MRVHGAPERSRVPVPSVTSQTMKPGIFSAAAASSWPSGLQLSAVTRHLLLPACFLGVKGCICTCWVLEAGESRSCGARGGRDPSLKQAPHCEIIWHMMKCCRSGAYGRWLELWHAGNSRGRAPGKDTNEPIFTFRLIP